MPSAARWHSYPSSLRIDQIVLPSRPSGLQDRQGGQSSPFLVTLFLLRMTTEDFEILLVGLDAFQPLVYSYTVKSIAIP